MPWEYDCTTTHAPIEEWPEQLNVYGDDGWELVSTFVVERGVHKNQSYALTMAVFKRRVIADNLSEMVAEIAAAQESE